MESFYSSKFARTPQFYSDSGSTGQTGQAHRSDGMAVAGLATRRPTSQTIEGHHLTGGVSLIGFVPNLGANICPLVFLVKLAV
jgi:hypothetical protein